MRMENQGVKGEKGGSGGVELATERHIGTARSSMKARRKTRRKSCHFKRGVELGVMGCSNGTGGPF